MFAWLGLLVTLMIWIGLAVLLVRWHGRKLGSISAHGSSARGAAWVFRAVLVGGGALMYWWLLGWFIPHLQLTELFTIGVTILIVYQIATGLNNGTSGLSKEIHGYSAQLMALLYIPLSVLILESHSLSIVSRVICSLLLVYLVNSYVVIEVMKKFRHIHLVFQLLYIVAFQLLLLSAAYLS